MAPAAQTIMIIAIGRKPLVALPPPRVMYIIIMAPDIRAIGRYVQTAEESGTASGRVGGSWRLISPSGISGARRRTGLRKIKKLNGRPPGVWARHRGRTGGVRE